MDIKYKGQSLGGGGGGTEIPAGLVCMWSGTADNIPDGWALCDGTNGTPDLRGRFIVGAGNAYAVGAKGGSTTVTLSLSQIPSHSHGITVYSAGNSQSPSIPANSVQMASLKGSPGAAASGSSGGNAAHNNMPPYYALCYIMKL